MKTIFLIAMLALCSGLCARADGTTMTNTNLMASSPSWSDYSADSPAGKIGVGVIIGEPTGASVKYWLNDTLAVDGAVGGSFHPDTDAYVHGDVLWHNFDLLPVSQGRLPVYLGVGGLARFRDNGHANEVGVRGPVGLSYMFNHAPVDIFVEVAPAIDFAPSVHGEITGGIGVRYWF